MDFYCQKIPAKDWVGLSETAHSIAFGKHKPAEWDRIDFCLLVKGSDGADCGYVTCKEPDSSSIFWEFGGAFPGTKGTLRSYGVYNCLVTWSLERYERIMTVIENDNLTMLKMAAKIGFKIIGLRTYKQDVLLEHLLERKDFQLKGK